MKEANVTLYAMNFIDGMAESEVDAIDLDASIDECIDRVKKELGGRASVEWCIVYNVLGEEPPICANDFETIEAIMDAQRAVWDLQCFWVTR